MKKKNVYCMFNLYCKRDVSKEKVAYETYDGKDSYCAVLFKNCLVIIFGVLIFTGCTSYKNCRTLESRQIARYKQNIIMDKDPCHTMVWKGFKHAFWDVATLGFCELWYARVRSTYEATAYYKIKESIENSKVKETKVLDSFLGIKFGQPLPTQSEDFSGVTEVDDLVYRFNTIRKFSDRYYAYKYNIYLTPDNKTVWKISAVADFTPDRDQIKQAETADLMGPTRSFTSGIVVNNTYSGTTVTYRSHDAFNSLFKRARSRAKEEADMVYMKLCERYGKQPSEDRILRFNNGMRISAGLIINYSEEFAYTVEISAYDESKVQLVNKWMEDCRKKEERDKKLSF